MRARHWTAATLGIAALAPVGYLLAHPTVTVRLDRDAVQRRVDAKLPLAGVRLGVAYEVARAAVDLRPDGRIGVEADVAAQALNRTVEETVLGSALVAYDDGAFYLTGFRVERVAPRAVDEPAVPEERAPGRLSAAIGALGLRDRAARALEAAGVKDGAGFLTAGKEAVVALARDRAAEMLAGALDRHPVYRLDPGDFRQSLARLALRDVRVEDGHLVVELSALRAAARLILYALAAVAALAALALLLGGSAGMAALLAVGAAG